MYLVCFLCAFKIDENVCVHAAFTLSGQHKTDENSSILCIHYYLRQHDYMNRALSKEEQSNIKGLHALPSYFLRNTQPKI